jgi:intracellular sulfur oxidation DsrE/DsrF family protein
METDKHNGISRLEFQKVQILLSEKRTAQTTFRSGITVCALPLTIISFLIATSSLYDIGKNSVMLAFVLIGCLFLMLFGTYLIARGLIRFRFHDKKITQLLENNKDLSSIFYHGHKMDRKISKSKNHTPLHYDIVFHFDKSESELKIAISNMKNYFIALKDVKFSAVLVVNGPGIKLMGKDNEYAASLKELSDLGLGIRVCQNAINHFDIESTSLIPFCQIVPAGVLEIVNLQREGYAYLKP